jgi:hypothetical protein
MCRKYIFIIISLQKNYSSRDTIPLKKMKMTSLTPAPWPSSSLFTITAIVPATGSWPKPSTIVHLNFSRSPGIDSKESIPSSAYVCSHWRAGTITAIVPATGSWPKPSTIVHREMVLFKLFKELRNRFQEINSDGLCCHWRAGTTILFLVRFLAPIGCSKVPEVVFENNFWGDR